LLSSSRSRTRTNTLARLDLVADPIDPEKPLTVAVFTAVKKDVFGPHTGEVVAG
jgi:hypothetical protein